MIEARHPLGRGRGVGDRVDGDVSRAGAGHLTSYRKEKKKARLEKLRG